MNSIITLFFLYVSAVSATDDPSQRIGGGTLVPITSYPFATALLNNPGSGVFTHRCGGSILTRNAILSAASCFYTGNNAHDVVLWRARVGSAYSNSGGTIYIISRITPYTGFSPTTRANDIAVLRTRFNIQFEAGLVEAAGLVGRTYTFSNDQAVEAIGWGAVSSTDPAFSVQLRRTVIWVVDQQICSNRYSELGFTVASNMVCLGWLDVGVRGQCQGDNGSPILDNGAVVGVFSWAEGCALGRYPGINTRLSPYLQWVVSTATAA